MPKPNYNETPLTGTSTGSDGLMSNDLDRGALERAQRAKDALVGSHVGLNGLGSNELDKAIERATPKKG